MTDEAPAEDPVLVVRRLMQGLDRATLATSLAEGDWPYASLVLTACDARMRPLLYISDLAQHTRNLTVDPRASLLFDGTQGLDDPLTGSRVSVLGRLEPVEDEAALDLYVARHDSAKTYRSFRDFRLWRMTPERAHLVAGFGKIVWLERKDLVP